MATFAITMMYNQYTQGFTETFYKTTGSDDPSTIQLPPTLINASLDCRANSVEFYAYEVRNLNKPGLAETFFVNQFNILNPAQAAAPPRS
jgi:hypothetical protein